MRRRLRDIRIIVIAALALAAIPLPAAAQRATFDVRVTDDGVAVSDVEVYALINRTKVPLGETDEGGRTEVAIDLLNVTKVGTIGVGEEVRVVVRTCREEPVAVALLPPGEEEDCEEENERGEECGCEPIAVFPWGHGDVHIDVGTGILEVKEFEDPRPDLLDDVEIPSGPFEPRVKTGLGLTSVWFPNLTDVASEDPAIASSDASSPAVGVQALLLLQPFRHLGFGTQFGWMPIEIDQAFVPVEGSVGATRGEIDLDVWMAEVYAFVPLRLGPRTVLSGIASLVYLWNEAEVRNRTGDHTGTESRSDSGMRLGLGGSLEQRLGSDLSLHLDGRYVMGEENDADEHFRLGAGICMGFGS